MHDAPDLAELVASARGFVENELIDGLSDPRLRFRARVAAYVLAIAEREAASDSEDLREEARRLAELLGGESAPKAEASSEAQLRAGVERANRELVRRLRHGELEAKPGTSLWSHLRRVTADRLRISNPAFLARSARGGESASADGGSPAS